MCVSVSCVELDLILVPLVGPLVWSERARDNEYALSLLERLLGCEIYKSCKSSEGTRLGISLLTRLTKVG